MKNKTKRITGVVGLLLSVAVVVSLASCNKTDTAASRTMVVVFTKGQATIDKDGKSAPVKVGMLVAEKDTIKTEQGMVDLQTKSGSAIRVKDYTTLTVASLYDGKNSDTHLSMNHGSLMANVDKKANDEDFKITTPTAIAGVRGTTFTVEANEGEPTRVKVMNGKVAMSPRFTALENVSKEDISGNENLQKLEKLQESQEMIIEESKAGYLDTKIEAAVRNVNEQTDKAKDKPEVIEVISQVFDEVDNTAKQSVAVVVEKEEVTLAEEMEKESLVVVDEEIVENIQQGNQTTATIAKLTEQRNQKQEVILEKIEKKAAETKLNNEEEIRTHYNKLEVVNLKNGTSMRGAVIAQTGNVLVIHSPDGVKRVNTSEVESISYP